jgi:peptidoglycan/LPS O-acetylase OafA/YrhL
VARVLGSRPALDGVRALAIVGVMGLHADARLFRGGFYGVDIFFVLSAFLITSLIIEECDARGGRYDFRAFYWRRAFRLGPALVLWLVLIAPPTAIAIHQGSQIPIATAASLFYFSDYALAVGVDLGDAYTHVWSLSIEEQFYMVWPWILVAVLLTSPARVQRWALVAAVPAAVLVMVVTGHWWASNYYLPSGHIVPLAVGCLTANLFMRGAPERLEQLVRSRVVGIACIALLAAVIVGYRPINSAEQQAVLLLVISLVVGALLLHLCLGAGGTSHRLFSLPPVLWVGRRSYGLYLYHRTLAILIPALIPGMRLTYAAPLVLAISLILAGLSFRFVERPINRGGRSWLRSRSRVAHVPELIQPTK